LRFLLCGTISPADNLWLNLKDGCNMNKAIWLFVPVLLLFSQGCVTYPVVGSFDGYNETFKGTVTASLFTGTSNIRIEGVDGTTNARGSSWVTFMAPTMNCEGTKGDVLLTFSDGRVVNAEFHCLSCSSGWGSGKDQNGNVFRFTFGMSDEEAEQFIEKARSVVAELPSRPADGEEPVEFEYDAQTKRGYISVKGKGPEARAWMLKQIGEICASKNIVIQKGETAEPPQFRVLNETLLDGKFTIEFELVR
jgi:hypothetical protein